LKSPPEASLFRDVDEHTQIKKRTEPRLREYEHSIHQDCGLGKNGDGAIGQSGMSREVVDWDVDRVSSAQEFQMSDQEIRLKAVGVVEVDGSPSSAREVPKVSIIRVMIEHRHMVDPQLADESGDQCGLPRATAAGYAYEDADTPVHTRFSRQRCAPKAGPNETAQVRRESIEDIRRAPFLILLGRRTQEGTMRYLRIPKSDRDHGGLA
jgi:hypothetical protein